MPDESIPQLIEALEAIYQDLPHEIRQACLGIIGAILLFAALLMTIAEMLMG